MIRSHHLVGRAYDRPAPFGGMHHFPLAADCGCAPGHHMEVTSQACANCGLTELQLFEHGNRPCQRGLWPLDVAVPPRKVKGLHQPAEGWVEGQLCLRNQPGFATCTGVLEIRTHSSMDAGACYCAATHAPCSWCTSQVVACPVCDFEGEPA